MYKIIQNRMNLFFSNESNWDMSVFHRKISFFYRNFYNKMGFLTKLWGYLKETYVCSYIENMNFSTEILSSS